MHMMEECYKGFPPRRQIQPTASPWAAWPIRHTLMVACTTTGNPRDCFIKRPGQTSMYYHYGPWHCHVSAPHWGLLWTGGVNKKKEHGCEPEISGFKRFLVFASLWERGWALRCTHTMHSLTCVSVVVCVACKLRPCPSYSRRWDRINLGLGEGGTSVSKHACDAS